MNERIARLARDERLVGLVGLGWGFAEGLFFFIVPDVWISFAALFSLQAGAVAWLASIAGSVAAVTVIYLLVVGMGLDYAGFLATLPGISAGMIERVRTGLAAGELPYTPWLVLGGVPLKVYAGAAFSLGAPLTAVLLWTVFARIVRIAPAYAAAAAVRLVFRRTIDARPWFWCGLLVGFWIVFYVLYFMRMNRA